ncbi:MAG: hypothetical protein Q9179_002616 [Wetmoreana sp. 5 TL-2023]
MFVEDWSVLHGDALSLIIARTYDSMTNTIASTLVYIFYRLSRHPDHMRKLQEELNSLDSPSGFADLQHAQHLNSVIKETMRLHPAAITGTLRETPPEGAMISGRFVPGRIKTFVDGLNLLNSGVMVRASPRIWIRALIQQARDDKKQKGSYAICSRCIGKSLAL